MAMEPSEDSEAGSPQITSGIQSGLMPCLGRTVAYSGCPVPTQALVGQWVYTASRTELGWRTQWAQGLV